MSDATKAFGLTLTTQEDVAGLPASLLSLAAQAAREAGASGATPEHGPGALRGFSQFCAVPGTQPAA